MPTTIAAAEEPDPQPRPRMNPFFRADLAQQRPPSEEPDDDEIDPQAEIRRWREEASATAQLRRDLEKTHRDLAILGSGVDFDHPHGKLFLDSLEKGVLTPGSTAQEIRAAAAEYGIPLRGE